jgi:hypothetical protein
VDRGLPVTFAPGEATFTGSPILEEFAEKGGTLRFSHDFEGTATLVCLTPDDQEVHRWDDLPGIYEGGTKEHRFKSTLRNAPFTFEFGPIGKDLAGSIKFTADPKVWVNQRLRTASYFEKTYTFFKRLVENPRLCIEGQQDGNRFFRVTAKMVEVERMQPFVRFLEIVAKARRVAEHCAIDPICTEDNLKRKDSLQDIEITHDVLFEDGYKYKYANVDVEVSFLTSEAAKITEAERELHDLVLYTNEDYSYKFMDIPITMGILAVCLTDTKMNMTDQEFRERVQQAGDRVELSYSCSATTKYSIRKPTAAELADMANDHA